ncbi:MAG: SRPBCC family protein, partial [Vicinamibacteria bacterium]
GTCLVLRSGFNLPWRRITGLGAGRTAVDVRKDIYVDAPIEEVFDFWSNFENMSKFLSNVKEVRRTENPNEYQWTVAGPAGVPVEWNAVVTKRVLNELIGWKTVSDAIVKNAGMVQFRPHAGGTRVDVHLKYNPGIGALGHAAAKLFGSDPKSLMDEDLVRMKTYLESGRTLRREEERTSLSEDEP